MWAVGAVQRQTGILQSRSRRGSPRNAASTGYPGIVLAYGRAVSLLLNALISSLCG